MGIEVLPPSVNESGWKFTVTSDRQIRFGLGAIRHVGRTAIESIIAARVETGPYHSLTDFCERVDLRLCNKRVFESLIAAGALDQFGEHRAQLTAALDTALVGVGLAPGLVTVAFDGTDFSFTTVPGGVTFRMKLMTSRAARLASCHFLGARFGASLNCSLSVDWGGVVNCSFDARSEAWYLGVRMFGLREP